MKKTGRQVTLIKLLSVSFFLQFIFSGELLSQNYKEDFLLAFPKKIISNGNYNAIEFMDSRLDRGDLGYVYSGPGNKLVQVIAKTDLTTQLKDLLKRSIDSSTAEGELLLQLRKFKFLERPERASEFGFCLFRADLYLKQDSTYKKLNRIDTIIIVEAPEATKPLFESASNAIVDFVLKNLTRDFSNTENYTYRQIVKMDSIEKSKLKLYTTDQYTNGVYKTYASFKDQIPDLKIIEVVYKQEKVAAIKTQNAKDKKFKLRPDEFYAFVNDGKPYISAEYGCYPLEKKNNDLFFSGEGKMPQSEAVAADAENGSAKDLTLILPPSIFKIRIDHIDGSLMRVANEIKY